MRCFHRNAERLRLMPGSSVKSRIKCIVSSRPGTNANRWNVVEGNFVLAISLFDHSTGKGGHSMESRKRIWALYYMFIFSGLVLLSACGARPPYFGPLAGVGKGTAFKALAGDRLSEPKYQSAIFGKIKLTRMGEPIDAQGVQLLIIDLNKTKADPMERLNEINILKISSYDPGTFPFFLEAQPSDYRIHTVCYKLICSEIHRAFTLMPNSCTYIGTIAINITGEGSTTGKETQSIGHMNFTTTRTSYPSTLSIRNEIDSDLKLFAESYPNLFAQFRDKLVMDSLRYYQQK